VLLKLTLPEQADFYTECVRLPKVVRVVALSGGYIQAIMDPENWTSRQAILLVQADGARAQKAVPFE
jgi:hypothetical protein